MEHKNDHLLGDDDVCTGMVLVTKNMIQTYM